VGETVTARLFARKFFSFNNRDIMPEFCEPETGGRPSRTPTDDENFCAKYFCYFAS